MRGLSTAVAHTSELVPSEARIAEQRTLLLPPRINRIARKITLLPQPCAALKTPPRKLRMYLKCG